MNRTARNGHRAPWSDLLRRGVGLLAALTLVTTTGCIGSISRDELDTLVHERGGGLSADTTADAIERIRAKLGVDDLALLSVSVSADSITAQVRSPEFERESDAWTVYRGTLSDPRPLADAPPGPRPPTFAGSTFDGDAFEGAVDEAVATAGIREGWASSAALDAVAGGGYEISVTVTNERSTTTRRFTSSGESLDPPT